MSIYQQLFTSKLATLLLPTCFILIMFFFHSNKVVSKFLIYLSLFLTVFCIVIEFPFHFWSFLPTNLEYLILVCKSVSSARQLNLAATLINGCWYQSQDCLVWYMKKASKVILAVITDKLSNLSGLTKRSYCFTQVKIKWVFLTSWKTFFWPMIERPNFILSKKSESS